MVETLVTVVVSVAIALVSYRLGRKDRERKQEQVVERLTQKTLEAVDALVTEISEPGSVRVVQGEDGLRKLKRVLHPKDIRQQIQIGENVVVVLGGKSHGTSEDRGSVTTKEREEE